MTKTVFTMDPIKPTMGSAARTLSFTFLNRIQSHPAATPISILQPTETHKALNIPGIPVMLMNGAIAVNGAIVVGYKLAGMAGVLTSVLATVIPPFVILSVISLFYAAFRSNLVVGWMLNGMQAGVGAVIAQVVWEMGSGIVKDRQWISVCIMIAAFAANYIFGVNVILIILFCALIGVARTIRSEKARKKGVQAS